MIGTLNGVVALCAALLLSASGSLPVVDGPAPAAAARSVQIGMTLNARDTDEATITRELDLLARMGVTWVRASVDWPMVEPERGAFDWSYPDRVVEGAHARGMRVIGLLAYTPAWARRDGGSTHAAPDRVGDYVAYARAAVQRYAPRGVHVWEVWNEPNICDFWQPRPDPARYGELFVAAVDAIRRADPEAFVLTGGMTRGATTPDGCRISQLDFLRALYRNGAARRADAIAVHPYSFPALPVSASSAGEGGFQDLPRLRELMVANGDGGKQVWVTEFGAPTGSGPEAMSESGQAASLNEARAQMRQWGWTGPLIYYQLRDTGTDPRDMEQNFGVLRRDFSEKQAGKELLESAGS